MKQALLSGKQIAFARAQYERVLTDRAEIQTPRRTRDGGGGWTEVYRTTSKNVPCHVGGFAGARPNEKANEAAEGTSRDLFISFAHNVVVNNRDRILVNGYTFEVLGAPHGRTDPVGVRVAVVEVS